MLLTPADARKQVNELMAEKKVSPEYLNLFCELYTAEYKFEEKLALKDLYPPLSKEEIRRRLAEGQPAVEIERLEISETALVRFLREIEEILARFTEDGKQTATRLIEAANNGQVSLRELVQAVTVSDQEYFERTAEKLGIGIEELLFLAVPLARPVFRRLARSVQPMVDIGEESFDRCPVCGGAPLMARIKEEDGRRVVACSVCGTEWVARRLRCLACGNEQEGTLGYLFIENDACRINKCEKCHAYIKTADERKNEAIKARALMVEDAATLYLDILAEQKGLHTVR